MVIGAFVSVTEAYSFLRPYWEPQEIIAYIKEANYQGRKYAYFVVDFRNPTSDPQSINEVRFMCYTLSDETFHLLDYDFAIAKMKLDHDLSKGFILAPAERKVMTYKVPQQPKKISQLCDNIQPVWTDAEIGEQKGDIISVKFNEPMRSQMIFNRPALIKNRHLVKE